VPKPIRRIVTGHTHESRSTIVSDEPAPQVTPGAVPQAGSTVLWVTDRAPASNEGNADAAPAGVRHPIPPPWRGGTILRVVDFVPRSQAVPSGTTLEGVNRTPERTERHSGFHQTDTVDYAVVLEGEIWAMLDEAETLMKPGDVLIQRGTYHTWDNRSEMVARVLFVLIDADPIRPS
jgi:hypothetical protein